MISNVVRLSRTRPLIETHDAFRMVFAGRGGQSLLESEQSQRAAAHPSGRRRQRQGGEIGSAAQVSAAAAGCAGMIQKALGLRLLSTRQSHGCIFMATLDSCVKQMLSTAAPSWSHAFATHA